MPHLTLVQREAAAGVFSADILADDGQERLVVIENQLESTNHDHLGKLITYLSNLDAKIAVWITSAPRPEHERAVHWLNEILPADMAFYLLQMEDAQVELYIDRGDAEQNKQLFDAFYARKEEIEVAFGEPLEWQRLDAKRACRVRFLLLGGGLLDQHRWPDIQDRMIDAMIRLEGAFKPHIQRLNLS